MRHLAHDIDLTRLVNTVVISEGMQVLNQVYSWKRFGKARAVRRTVLLEAHG